MQKHFPNAAISQADCNKALAGFKFGFLNVLLLFKPESCKSMGSFQGLGREVFPSLGESSTQDPDSLSAGFEERREGAPDIPGLNAM